MAARAHLSHLDAVIAEAMREAGLGFADLAAVAATGGPGLIGGVLVGTTTAKAIALMDRLPFLGINHLEGHALTARLTDGVGYPYLLLLVSGGHCQLLAVEGVVYLQAVTQSFLQRLARYSGIVLLGFMMLVVLAVLGIAQATVNRANVELRRRAERLEDANTQLRDQIVKRQRAEEALRQATKMESIDQLTGGIAPHFKIGKASGRARVGQSGEIQGG